MWSLRNSRKVLEQTLKQTEMQTITIDKMLGIDYPVIVAPMFLVTNIKMMKAALENGISIAFPALNYRTDKELRAAIEEIKSFTNKPLGVNLIVNKSNPKYKSQLETLIELKVSYIITSLGSPQEVIEKCKPLGIKVFCDVVDVKYAKKVEELGADAVIAVNSRAGGHAGNVPLERLVPMLKQECSIPIISAGGVAKGVDIKRAMELGAAGVSVGTLFMASEEAGISEDYKQALIEYGEKDIVRTSKLSGSPLTVINTPYVQTIGTKATFLERIINNNKSLKKYAKMLMMYKGMKQIEKAAFSATYKTVWVAGPAIEQIKNIRSMKEIVQTLVKEYDEVNKLPEN